VNAKTAQEHDYSSKAHRRSCARRTAVERSNSRVKDPASVDVAKGWCRITGPAPISLFLACALPVRNLAVSNAFTKRALDEQRRKAVGFAARRRRPLRGSLADLLAASPNAPPQSLDRISSGTGTVLQEEGKHRPVCLAPSSRIPGRFRRGVKAVLDNQVPDQYPILQRISATGF
jgi:hypothetical protein